MADTKSSLARDGTMQVTAKEGIEYLESAGKDRLLERQGLKESKPDKPTVARDGTMMVTAKEANALLGSDKPDEDAKTRGQNVKIQEAKEEPPAKKSRMAKGVTMIGTAQEAEQILGGNKPDADAMTRGQQKKIAEISKETPPTPTKKPRMAKEGTMAATAKEAKAYYIGKDKLGDTRSESKALKQTAGTPKKTTSIAKTIGEAAYVVPDINVNEGRRTRSQSNPKPAMKRAGTMQQTAKDGKEFLKRGRKSKKAAAQKIVEADEEEEEEDDE
ncbi:uncharacterized protein [Argopecten irradians]|uniref:uncharacterized protein n=1 Tax=Argopecten irradians TaxID=31199 RepID=UPI0037156619